MLQTLRASRGMATAPHHLASQSALSVLQDGGNAVEATVAAAATIAVAYPHMNGLGGDGFWLIAEPGEDPVAIDASGGAAAAATPAFYAANGFAAIPTRGPMAALTVAGTVSGWRAALEYAGRWADGRQPLERLLVDAIVYAREGVPVTASLRRFTEAKRAELEPQPGFAEVYLPQGEVPQTGALFRQKKLGDTLQWLAEYGLDDFYRGELAEAIAADLEAAGSPLTRDDLAGQHARLVEPLRLRTRDGTLYNMPPPTQGVASLTILGLFDRLAADGEGFAHVHGLLEATKQAFLVRDAELADPESMRVEAQDLLTDAALDRLAGAIDPGRALAWPPQALVAGDTVWLGVIDRAGRAVSFIQSIFWEFGSGVVLPQSGLVWQNRGAAFRLDDGAVNRLTPGRRPFHTLNPALARLADGRQMVYGAMGGEGQPQTQAAVFTRYARFGQGLQQAVTAPRWLLGRTWGAETTTLKLEDRFDDALVADLQRAGHRVETAAPYDDLMGHAGALVRLPWGVIEGAADPRSDGAVAGF